jgi:hypothetical protein
MRCATPPPPNGPAIGNRRHSFLLIVAGYFVRAAAISVPGPRDVRFRIEEFLDFRLFVVRMQNPKFSAMRPFPRISRRELC